MKYEEILKEWLLVRSNSEALKDKIIRAIEDLFKERNLKGIWFSKLTHKIDGPLTDFRLIKTDETADIKLAYTVFTDALSYDLRSCTLGEIKFIYEIVYHQFYDIID